MKLLKVSITVGVGKLKRCTAIPSSERVWWKC